MPYAIDLEDHKYPRQLDCCDLVTVDARDVQQRRNRTDDTTESTSEYNGRNVETANQGVTVEKEIIETSSTANPQL